MLAFLEQYSFNYYGLYIFWPMNTYIFQLLEFVLQDFYHNEFVMYGNKM